jgi:hypothetical protein
MVTNARTSSRAIGLTLIALVIAANNGHASVIQSTVELPPATGSYAFGTFCFDPLDRCTVNPTVGGFTNIVRQQIGDDEVVTADATYSADIYTISGGGPGMLIGTLLMLGTVEFVYEGRNPGVNPLGVFTTTLSAFDFEGELGGNTFAVKKDPARETVGTTSILPISITPPIQYLVESTIEIKALYSFAGQPFLPAPGRPGELVSVVPEPGTGILGGAVLLALAGFAPRRRKDSLS